MFKVGDKVYSKVKGYGEVVTYNEFENYPVEVLFGEDLLTFTKEGKWNLDGEPDEKDIRLAADINYIYTGDTKFTVSESITRVLDFPLNIKYPEAYIQGLQFKISQIEKETKLEISREECSIEQCINKLNYCNELTSPIKEEIAKVIKYINGTNNE